MKGFRRGAKPPPVLPLRMLTPLEAGARLGISEDSVKALCRAGRFPNAKRIGSAGWRIPNTDVDAFILAPSEFVSTAFVKTTRGIAA